MNSLLSRLGSRGGYRWWICFLLFVATTLNFMDRQILSMLKPTLEDQLHWTNSQFGMINSCFQATYAIGYLFFGGLIDRWSLPKTYILAVVVWGIAAFSHAFASTLIGFCLARMLLGLGEGGHFPCAIKTVSQWFPRNERSFATSLFNSGSNWAAVLVPGFVLVISLHFGWQYCFLGPSTVAFMWIFFWIKSYQPPTTSPHVTTQERELILTGADSGPNAGKKVGWGELLGYRQTWAFVAAKFLTDPVWWFLLIWLPDFFKKTRGLDLIHSWYYLVTIYMVITVLSVTGGWVTGHLMSCGWSVTRARKTGLIVFALCVLPVVFVTQMPIWIAVLLIGLAGAAHQAWSANLFTTVSDIFPQRAVGSVIGIGGTAGALGGMLFPLFCGHILDIYQKSGNSSQGYSLLFIMCSSFYLLAFTINHLLSPKFSPLVLREN